MGRFESFIKGVTSPFVDDDPATPRERRHRERSRRRSRYNSPDTTEKGGEVNRRADVSQNIHDTIRGKAKAKPYDAVFLRDLSANAVVQAYIDTLSQDVAAANWSIKPRDEEANIDDETLAAVERRLRELPPGGASFRDMLEATVRVLLELGDATIVKHYYEDEDTVAEIIPVDSATLYKQVDDHGNTDGYVQVSLRNQEMKEPFDADDVIWVEWSSRPDRHYGQGPLEKAQNEVELIEELAEKERLDLIQGGPPGVISPEVLDEYGGLPDDPDWDTFVENMRLDEGERHRVGYSKTPVNFEPISHNYQELQILDRSKYWVTVIGSVFKVNPSYAGFDFENVNRATDESQRGAYQQRGFRVTLRQVEEALNQGLIWDEYSKNVRFEFEREQTVDEQKTRAELVEAQAAAGKEMANAGRTVAYRDGRLVVEDGELEEGDAGGGGGGGGLFGSVDDPDDADLHVEASKDEDGDGGSGNADSDGRELSKAQVAKLDAVLLRAFDRQITPPSVDDIEKRSWDDADDVPEFVTDGIQSVVDRGAVFSDFASVPGRVADTIRDTLSDSLTQPQGWSLDSMVDNLSDALPRADEADLETIARTESAKVLNEAREEGYRDRGLDDARFKWVGPDDSRTTEACDELKDMTNPDYGGSPVSLPELIDAERQVQAEHFENLSFRKHTIHPNERHTFVRHEGGFDDIDVDVPSAEDFGERFESGDMNVEPVEQSSKAHAHDEAYEAVVKRVGKATNPTRRMRELEDALGNHLPNLLRQCLETSDGTKRGALRELNTRLEESDEYDVEERGKVSPNTLYDWIGRYDTHVDHLT